MSDRRVGRRVAIVHLGRPGALGGERRVATWRSVTAAIGGQCHLVDLAGLRTRAVGPRRTARLLTGQLVPEALWWSDHRLGMLLHDLRPDVVVFVTARAFDPAPVAAGARVILDFVDVLSDSYRLRGGPHAPLARRVAFAALRRPMAHFERTRHPVALTTAAGYRDAQRLSARWLPNLLTALPPSPRSPSPRFDLLFHGNLRYEPNLEALIAFRSAWSALRAERPGTTLLVAGANPPRSLVAAVAQTPGWTLLPNFASLGDVLPLARVSVAPLRSASGFQNKILEAAAYGLPQVVTPAAARGLDPQFPVEQASTDAQWVRAVTTLLDDLRHAEELAARAREHLRRHYVPERHASLLDAS